MKLSDYDFILPEELIAKAQVYPRDTSKFLYVNNGEIKDLCFSNITDFLKEGDTIVFNNSKVIKALLEGSVNQKKVSINLNKKNTSNAWEAFVKPAKKVQKGDKIFFSPEFYAVILEKEDFGKIIIEFNLDGEEFFSMLDKIGKIPLPPYIKRIAEEKDSKTYQTIYAKDAGSVAAPTAGLHFSETILETIKNKKVNIAFVTLHVGAGTFLPIKTEDISEHKMHSEYCYIDKENAEIINNSRKNGGKIFAVGTTSMRILESIANENGDLHEFYGETDIFIKPGYNFKIVDALITNFHLPKSSLLVLVSTFAGFEEMKKAYEHAIKNKYRFYSYGDSSILFRKNNENITKNPEI